MLKLRTIMAVLCTAFITIYFSASIQAAEAPLVTEGFGCNFLDGKGFDDLEKATRYYDSQRSKIKSPELQKMRSVVWTPFRGSVDVDFVWFNTGLSWNDWGKATDAYDKSSEGKASQARFDAVASCGSSGLSTNEPLHRSEKQFEDDGEVLIESFRCELHPGKSIADSDAALAAWEPVFKNAVKATNAASFVGRRVPIISGSGFDLSYYAVWDDASAYAAANSAFDANPDSAKSDALFAEAHRCRSALFKGRVVVRPAE